MARARFARRAADAWSVTVVAQQPVRDVSGAGGLVVAGSASALLMVRPGTQTCKARPQLGDLPGPAVAVAAEQARPWRYAVACAGGIAMMGLPGDQMLTLTSTTPEIQVTHMAWARFLAGREQTVLYLRWTDGAVGRVRLDLGTIEHLHVLPMDAIASDANGVLAMVAVRRPAGDAHALWTRDGIRLEERPVQPGPSALAQPAGEPKSDPETRVHLAVADEAIAYAIGGQGAHVSRGIDEDFSACEELAQAGPLAFHGTAASAALFGVVRSAAVCAIDRAEAGEARDVQRVVEIVADSPDSPRIEALQWDASRRALWAASPQAGLTRVDEPGAGGHKAVGPS